MGMGQALLHAAFTVVASLSSQISIYQESPLIILKDGRQVKIWMERADNFGLILHFGDSRIAIDRLLFGEAVIETLSAEGIRLSILNIIAGTVAAGIPMGLYLKTHDPRWLAALIP